MRTDHDEDQKVFRRLTLEPDHQSKCFYLELKTTQIKFCFSVQTPFCFQPEASPHRCCSCGRRAEQQASPVMSSAERRRGADTAPSPAQVIKHTISGDEEEEEEEEDVTWKESSRVVHSSPHRSDKTAVAATEKIRLIRIPT